MTDARSGLTAVRAWLSHPVDAASLHAFRRLFALLMLVSVIRFAARGWIAQIYVDPPHHFPFWGLEWLRPWPGPGMYIHFAALALAALALLIARDPRRPALAFFALFTWVELLEQTAYLNHYYLVSLISLLLAFAPRSGRSLAPRWILTALRLQVGLVYVFAGLAKLRADWLLHAQPLRTWLAAHGDFPALGPLFLRPDVALAMSWAGAVFDLSAPFLLLHPRTRVPALVAVAGFHTLTGLLFPIGMFPWVMVCGALLLLPPDWPRRLARRLGRHAPIRTVTAPPVLLSRTGLALLALWFTVQLLLPLRRHLYGDDVGWTEHGFRYAWHVMLVEKTGMVTYRVRDPRTGRTTLVHPEDRLTPQQAKQMAIAPDLILQHAHALAREFAARGVPAVEVRADAWIAYNGRPSARYIDPDVDLARVPDDLAPRTWLLPVPPR
ncbi:MAG: HTTM domain-containing protein [Myxococcales bacterium]|nr:HTTM domain-containing protein [Myxococcales bacterium]